MCGIAGVYSAAELNERDLKIIEQMNYLQRHRGPDDEGIFVSQNCILGHKRLAIIDLSKDGHQPFYSEDNRYILTFNGEIYNYIELREELKQTGWIFRTKTDIEVLLASYIKFGKNCLDKILGMFSFVIYDSIENKIFFARDHVGIKPFYYTIINNKFYFTSEIKALLAIPELKKTVNKQSLFDYLCFNRTDVFDETFINEIKRLPKGHYGFYNQNEFVIKQYWNPSKFIDIGFDKNSDYLSEINEIFTTSVKMHMRSDVNVGCCLSGGLDSSILVGNIYKQFPDIDNFKTFTASFPGKKIDETNYIDLLNKKYPFKNYRTYPDEKAAFNDLYSFVYTNDEPTTFPTFYSQYQVMKLAKENNITVLLDGQGGDENFAGYQYFHGFNFTGLYKERKIYKLIQELYKSLIRKQEKEAFQTFIFQTVSNKLKKKFLLNTLPYINKDFFYEHIDNSRIFNEFFQAADLNQSLVMHFKYKLEHLLRMEDRNSMAFQIEARVPYLDRRLIEFLLAMPAYLKLRKGETKCLQKISLGKYTIPEIISRKDKLGFATPSDEWMNSEIWKDFTTANHIFLINLFPDIFVRNAKLKNNTFSKWEINQLAIWYNLFIKNKE